jgi:glycosyltransferase involved in cell wall biosynthesis
MRWPIIRLGKHLPMRILHLGYTHVSNPWNAGGAAVAAREVYSRLADRHEIVVLAGGWSGAPADDTAGPVRSIFGPRARGYLASRLGYSRAAAKWAGTSGFDLVVDDMSAYSPSFAWRRRRGPMVALIQLDLIRASRKYPVIGAIARRYVREALAAYRDFICVTPSLLADTAPLTAPDRRAVLIPNGVSADLLSVEPREEPYLLFLGRLDRYTKGLDILLAEYGRFAASHDGIRLLIAGDGPDGPRLRTEVARTPGLSGRVEFLGRVGGQAKTDLLAQCLCVVMPSRHEGWPLVAMEAAACRKAVVGSTAPGLSDAVVDQETGLLVDTSQTGALADALGRVVDNAALRGALGYAARERARRFTWDAIALQYEAFYQSVCEER